MHYICGKYNTKYVHLEDITNTTTNKIWRLARLHAFGVPSIFFTQNSINERLHGPKSTNLHGGSLLTYDHVK